MTNPTEEAMTLKRYDENRLREFIAAQAGWRAFPYGFGDDTRMIPPGKQVHISNLEPLPSDPELFSAVAVKQEQADAAHAAERTRLEGRVKELEGAIAILPDPRCGSKTGRPNYCASVSNETLLRVWEAVHGPLSSAAEAGGGS